MSGIVPKLGGRDLLDLLARLDRRVATLERASRLTNSSIQSGALSVFDDTEAEVIRVGKQDDGTYGISTTYAPEEQYIDLQLSYSSSTSGFVTGDGPDLTGVKVSRHLMVVVSAYLTVAGTNSEMLYTWDLSGAQVDAATDDRGLRLTSVAKGQFSYVALHTDLTPGLYNVTANYKFVAGTGTPSGTVANRRIIAIPFW